MSLSPPVSVATLTPENLRQFPVWRYLHDEECGEGTDESFVTPADEVPSVGAHGSFVVAASYLLHGGGELSGAVQLDQLGAKRLFTPILIHIADQCLDPLATDLAARLSRLQKTPVGPPVRWTLGITLPGDKAPASGRIFRSGVLRALALLAQLVSLFFTRRRQ